MKLSDYKLVFNSEEHKYSLYHKETGEYLKDLLGTTTLLTRQGLSVDYSQVPEELLNNARIFGDLQHKMFEQYYNGVRTKEEVNEVALKGIKTLERYGIVPISNELKVYNFNFAGIIDMLGFMGEELVMIDYKFTYAFNRTSVGWQLNIYKRLLKELLNYDVKRLFCLWYNKQKKEFELREITLIEAELVEKLFQVELSGGNFYEEQSTYLKAIEKDLLFEKEIIKFKEVEKLYNNSVLEFEVVKSVIMSEMDELGISYYETKNFVITKVNGKNKYLKIKEKE
jgi:hypothetical protein